MNETKNKIQKIRNIAIAAHVDAGKTTLTERVLKITNKIHSIGEVHDGKATMDFMDLEAEKGITIQSACTTCEWKDIIINLIDTPGHIDFTIEVERALRVLDGAVIVLEGVAGVEAQSEKVYRQSEKHGIAKVLFVNKLDRAGADFESVVEQAKQKLNPNAVAIQTPYYADNRYAGFVDLIELHLVYWPTDDIKNYEILNLEDKFTEDEIHQFTLKREALIDTCLFNEEDIESFFAGKAVTNETIYRNIRIGTITNQFVPVLCGSAFKNKGVAHVLDAVAKYLPNPEEVERNQDLLLKEETNLLVFKITHDPKIGALYYCRIYSGTIEKNTKLINLRNKISVRINRIIQMNANQHINLNVGYTGDIVVLTSLNDVQTGDTLSSKIDSEPLIPIDIPRPVIEMTITPKTTADRTNLSLALDRLMKEDPSFTVEYDNITKETLIKGMGVLHLEIIVERIAREYKTNLEVGPPKVSFKETIDTVLKAHNLLKKQTGGHGSYAEVYITIEPTEEEGIQFESKIEGGVIPRNFWPAVERGLREEAQKGYYAGFPFTNIKFILTDGTYHTVDSSDLSFEMASKIAFRDALSTAKGVLLEPIMNIEVYSPSECVGDLMNDISSKRGLISDTKNTQWYSVIQATMPLLNILGHGSSPYIENLRRLTRGRATFTMSFSHYDVTPEHIATTYYLKH